MLIAVSNKNPESGIKPPFCYEAIKLARCEAVVKRMTVVSESVVIPPLTPGTGVTVIGVCAGVFFKSLILWPASLQTLALLRGSWVGVLAW
jgi:hypothetical protein